MSMGLKLMENMVNFSPDSDLLSDPVLLCIFSFYCQKCPKYLICCRLVMVLILRKTSCIEIYWRRLSGLGSDYWQSSACSYSSNIFTFQANILIWDTWIFYLAGSPCSVGIGMILGGILFISQNQKYFLTFIHTTEVQKYSFPKYVTAWSSYIWKKLQKRCKYVMRSKYDSFL